LITDDGESYGFTTSAGSMSALVALAQAGAAFAWDPTNRTLISANIVGTMAWTTKA
jgi:hypothetical protein